MTDWRAAIDRAVTGIEPRLVELRRWMHANPEASGEERETSLLLRGLLTDAGYLARLGEGEIGVLADVPGVTAARWIALRADLDALRIQDLKQVPYRSGRPHLMHACGHDGHTAAVVGALVALEECRREDTLPWPVGVRGLFQPAEETSEGALSFLRQNALEGIDALFALHMDPSRPTGRVGVRAGALTAACDALHIRISGRGGHAARPHESIDPIAAAAQLVSSLYLFIPRGVDSHEPVVLTVGTVHAGDNPNVIPEEAELRGTLRTLGGGIRERTREHVLQLARGLAEASGTRIDVRIEPGPPSVENDLLLTEIVAEAAADVVGASGLDRITRPSMGGEDFAYYQQQVPGAMFRLGCAPTAAGGPSLHSPLFDLDERALALGARILARVAVLASDPGRNLSQGALFPVEVPE